MCRQIAIPAGIERKEILATLRHFCAKNTDGVGYVQVVNGKFRVKKWPNSLYWAIQNTDFLNTIPHDGWTLIHLRAASHGGNTRKNTHPFIVNDRAVVHNGVWHDYSLAKLLLASQGLRPKGQTDTEVGANVLDIIGPQKFASEITGGGVFMSLNRDGGLEIAHTSGDLVVHKYSSGKVLVASELDEQIYPDAMNTVNGYMQFSSGGKYVRHFEKLNYIFPDYSSERDDIIPTVVGGKMYRSFSKLTSSPARKRSVPVVTSPSVVVGQGAPEETVWDRMLRLRREDEADHSVSFGGGYFGFGGGHWD